MSEKPSGKLLCHQACPCGTSSDGVAVYDRGNGKTDGYCWVCSKFIKLEESDDGDTTTHSSTSVATSSMAKVLDTFRGIHKDTLEYYGAKGTYSESNGELISISYPVTRDNKQVGYHNRTLPKTFNFTGDTKGLEMFGQSLCGSGGRLLVICEGYEDAMSAYQMFLSNGKKIRVVSMPNGANIKAIKTNLEWIESFDSICLCLDQDDPGHKLSDEISNLLTPSKVKVMSLPTKDANDMLMNGHSKEFYHAYLNASEYRPDGIVGIDDILENIMIPPEVGRSWPWKALTKLTYGRRRKELYGFGGGSGSGKSEIFKEIIKHIIEVDELPVGIIALEESPAHTAKTIAGKFFNKRFHIPDSGWTTDELERGVSYLNNKLFLYDHFGSRSWGNIRSKIRYMVITLGIKDIFLDHLTALVADEENVNGSLSSIMADMASLAQELDFTIYYISHLTTPERGSHEEGMRVKASQFRGSRTIAFWSHFLFGIERNQQAEDEHERNRAVFRILKDRFSGEATGHTINLVYNHSIGRLEEEGIDDMF